MTYVQMTPEEQGQLRAYVEAALDRFSEFRDNKETMAFAGLAVFLGAVATALVSRDWPPQHAQNPWLILVAFSILWLMVASYLRYQLRRRRWAALRVSGCDWLLAEWLPASPRAMSLMPEVPQRRLKPSWLVLTSDVIWPRKDAVVAIDPTLRVYPPEIEDAWLRAAARGTEALRLERLLHSAGWVGYLAVVLRTFYG